MSGWDGAASCQVHRVTTSLLGAYSVVRAAALPQRPHIDGMCICVCCCVCRVYGLLSLGRYVSPLPVPRKNHQLVTSGMYSECAVLGGWTCSLPAMYAHTRTHARL